MSIGRLILTPAHPDVLLPREQVEAHLRQIRLCAEALPGRPGRFAIGADFMQWISFAGCSAFIRFEAESADDEAFCHLALRCVEGPRPLFLSGVNTRPPACPGCRKALHTWPELMESWQRAGGPLHCPVCDQSIEPTALSWRRHAGMGRTLVELFNIFPGEARPLPALLERLGELDQGRAWRYFYLQ